MKKSKIIISTLFACATSLAFAADPDISKVRITEAVSTTQFLSAYLCKGKAVLDPAVLEVKSSMVGFIATIKTLTGSNEVFKYDNGALSERMKYAYCDEEGILQIGMPTKE